MKRILMFFAFLITIQNNGYPCSILYYIDKMSGKIYAINNEDYYLDTKAYVQIIPSNENELARLWYGWKGFAQGGINEDGLFFDGAVSPEQKIPDGYNGPKGNLGDMILANCKTSSEAIDFLERKKVALENAHMIFGDRNGDALIVEWVNAEKKIIKIDDNKLVLENFLLSNPSAGNYPSHRYQSIIDRIDIFEKKGVEGDLVTIGNFMGGAAQLPIQVSKRKTVGTLYTSFINISDMKIVIVPKLNSSKAIKINLKEEFQRKKKRKIRL